MSAMSTAPARTEPSRRDRLEAARSQALALLAAFGIALVVGSIIIVLYGENPFAVYGSILGFAFETPTSLGTVLGIATPLIFSALAVSVCFKGGLFNIGVEGQYLVGMISATAAALYLDFLPGILHLLAVLVFGAIGGLIYAAIPAILKVKTGAHEVVTTIMLNGIAVGLVAYALNGPLKFSDIPEGQNIDLRSDVFAQSALMPDLGKLLGIGPSAHLTWLFPLALLVAAAVWFLIRRMRLGYEARVVGSSPGSARAGGISIGVIQVKLFAISGALAGMVGMQQLIGERGALVQNYEAQLGFTGIAVAFLGQNNPIGIVFAAIVWGVLTRGETAVQLKTNLPREFVIILQGILIFSVVVVYQIARRRIAARELQRAAADDPAEPAEDGVSQEEVG
jgi:simple sugar transport system permease protein